MEQLLDKTTIRLLIECKNAVYKHLQAANKDVNPKGITVCGVILPSAKMILKYGDDMFVTEPTADKAHIKVRELVTLSCSIWDVL